MVNPILIAAPKRCGTTMLAYLLHLHGVWIGEARATTDERLNPLVGTENSAIKRYLQSLSGTPSDFREQIAGMVDTDGPWLFKAAQNLARQDAWLSHFPDAVWLLPHRPAEDCLASKARELGKGNRTPDLGAVQQQFAQQARIAKRARHSLYVSADALCTGDESEARKAVAFAGLTFDPAIYRSWVEPERWHGRV